MGRLEKAASAALCGLLLAGALPASALDDDDQKIVDRGLDSLYRSDFDGAEKILSEAMKAKPGDPALSLAYLVATWWRMENDFAPSGSEQERRFREAVDIAIRDGKHATESKDDPEAYVCLGAAYGLRGRLEAAQKHWIKAYHDGRRSYVNEQRAIHLNPNLYDAYLGIGAFDYYVGRLSRFVRLFVFAKPVDKEQGLAELQLATHGRFSGVAAKLLLVGINWTFEKNPKEAWRILEELHESYPESPMMDTMRMIGLFQLRDAKGLEQEARRFLDKAEKGQAHYRPIDRAGGHYFIGLAEQLAGNYEKALAQDREGLALVPEGHKTRGLPLLLIGECLDLLGRREEAVASYRQALKAPSFWGVPRYAKHLLKHPFIQGDNPLPSRNEELD